MQALGFAIMGKKQLLQTTLAKFNIDPDFAGGDKRTCLHWAWYYVGFYIRDLTFYLVFMATMHASSIYYR